MQPGADQSIDDGLLEVQRLLAFGDLLRNPVPTDDLMQGLLTTGVYAVVFLSAAWAWLSGKDITG